MSNTRMNYRQMLELINNPERMLELNVTDITQQIKPLVKERTLKLLNSSLNQNGLHDMQFGWKYGELQKFDHSQILVDFSKLLDEISKLKYGVKKMLNVVKIKLTSEEDTYFVSVLLQSDNTLEVMREILDNKEASEEFDNSQS